MTLQEYLVRLGWQLDEPSLKRFLGAVSSTGVKVAELGSVAVETAVAIETMVTRVARKYETLYYVAQRSSQSVRYIQSTQFAFKQIGLSAEEATASIESIAATLRTQPWLRAIFGGASTPQAVASRLGKSGLPYFLQTRFAEMIGMDEKTLFHLQRFGEEEAAAQANFSRRQREAGIDPEDLARKSTNFGRVLDRLESSLEIFGDRMAADFIDPTTKGVELMTKAVDWMTRVDNATKGWATTLATLAGTAGGLLILEKVLRRVLGLSGATATGKALGFGRRLLGRGLKGGWIGAAIGALETVKEDDPETKKQLRSALGPLFYELGLSKSADLNEDPGKPLSKTASTSRINQAVDALVKAGYPIESARGIAAGLYSESKVDPTNVNPTSGASGIAQWLGPRAKQFKEKFLHSVSEGTFEEQMQFLLYELEKGDPQSQEAGSRLKRGGMSSREAAGTFIHLFERPGPGGEASDMSRAGPVADALSRLSAQNTSASTTNNITLNSKTDVHVKSEGPDVASTARAYTDGHNQANENLVRNLQGVLR